MKVQVEVLRAALNTLLDHTKQAQGDVVDVDADLYWFVPKEALGVPGVEPTGLTLGSLEDDWTEVAAIGLGTKDPFGYGLVWASAVLRALGDLVP